MFCRSFGVWAVMRHSVATIAALAVICCTISASGRGIRLSRDSFPARRVLRPSAEEVICTTAVFRLDSTVYRRLNGTMTNLRLYGSDGREVPFAVRTVCSADTVRRRMEVRLERRSFAELPGNRIRLEFERDSTDSVPTALTILTPQKNFDKTVDVTGSENGKNWRALARNRPIFDYSRYADARITDVGFDPCRCRYYRVEVSNVTTVRASPYTVVVRGRSGDTRSEYEEFSRGNEVFRIDRVVFFREQTDVLPRSAVQQQWRMALASARVDSTRRTTEVVLRSNREPLRRLTVWTSTANFSRDVIVECSDDSVAPGRWRGAWRGHISNLDVGALERAERTLELPEQTRAFWYRITVDDGDNRPLAIDSVMGEGDMVEMVFFAGGAKVLTLCYGGPDSVAPRYEVERVLDGVTALQTVRWVAGPEELVMVKRRLRVVSGKTALVAAIAAMVAVLLWAVVVAGKRLGGDPV